MTGGSAALHAMRWTNPHGYQSHDHLALVSENGFGGQWTLWRTRLSRWHTG